MSLLLASFSYDYYCGNILSTLLFPVSFIYWFAAAPILHTLQTVASLYFLQRYSMICKKRYGHKVLISFSSFSFYLLLAVGYSLISFLIMNLAFCFGDFSATSRPKSIEPEAITVSACTLIALLTFTAYFIRRRCRRKAANSLKA